MVSLLFMQALCIKFQQWVAAEPTAEESSRLAREVSSEAMRHFGHTSGPASYGLKAVIAVG